MPANLTDTPSRTSKPSCASARAPSVQPGSSSKHRSGPTSPTIEQSRGGSSSLRISAQYFRWPVMVTPVTCRARSPSVLTAKRSGGVNASSKPRRTAKSCASSPAVSRSGNNGASFSGIDVIFVGKNNPDSSWSLDTRAVAPQSRGANLRRRRDWRSRSAIATSSRGKFASRCRMSWANRNRNAPLVRVVAGSSSPPPVLGRAARWILRATAMPRRATSSASRSAESRLTTSALSSCPSRRSRLRVSETTTPKSSRRVANRAVGKAAASRIAR